MLYFSSYFLCFVLCLGKVDLLPTALFAPVLYWASHNLSQELAQLLIDHGADIAAHNNEGKCPSDIAQNDSCRTFLLAAEEVQRNNHRYKRPRLDDLPKPQQAQCKKKEEQAEENEDDSRDISMR